MVTESKAINLFNIPNHKIDTSKFSHMLHGDVIERFEKSFAKYVGAKYACTGNSASSLLYLALKRFSPQTVQVPSTIPVVVPNVVANAGHKIQFYNDEEWVGSCYHLHDDIFDSAQEVTKDQYSEMGKDDAIMIFSFYPTKPVSGCDGGIVVSNNKDKIEHFKLMTMNGTLIDEDSWKRKHVVPGYKMHWTSMQAHIANENLKKLDEKNDVLSKISSVYNDSLGYNNKSKHLYRIHVKHNQSFLAKMLEEKIQCGIHYEHCHGKAFAPFELPNADLNKSEKTSTETISLPFHEELTFKEVEKVIYYVKKFKGI